MVVWGGVENLGEGLVSHSLEDSMLISVPLLNPLGQCACLCQYPYRGHHHCCPSQGIFSPDPYPLLPQTQHPGTQLSVATVGGKMVQYTGHLQKLDFEVQNILVQNIPV